MIGVSRWLALAGCIALLGCRNDDNKTSSNTLGQLDFTATGKSAAQPAFQRGMLLLHSFEYEDAAEAFLEARKIDSAFVMTYWGEAMSYNHPLWREQDMEAGRAALDALHPDPDKRVNMAATPVEKDFMAAVNILYGEGNKSERDSLYAAHMARLYDKYPGNDEVAAFYSLALNGWGYTEKNKETLERAAQVGFEVMSRNPRHPGALHYVIHAYDDPAFAGKALEAADQYAIVAADAGHALHMPTHIYLSLGMWDRVISSNIVSWNAEHARRQRKQLDNDALGYHAYEWLQYGYLQQGKDEEARVLLDSMKIYCEELPNKYARAHLVYQKTAFLANTNDYASGAADIGIDTRDLNIAVQCADWFAEGYGAYLEQDLPGLESVIQKMEAAVLLEGEKAADKGLRLCGNINRSQVTADDITEADMMTLELQALAAALQGKPREAEAFFQKAVDKQTAYGPFSGPPMVTRLPQEMYGQWLLQQQRPAEAAEQFKQALLLAPNRRPALIGQAAAEKALQNQVASR